MHRPAAGATAADRPWLRWPDHDRERLNTVTRLATRIRSCSEPGLRTCRTRDRTTIDQRGGESGRADLRQPHGYATATGTQRPRAGPERRCAGPCTPGGVHRGADLSGGREHPRPGRARARRPGEERHRVGADPRRRRLRRRQQCGRRGAGAAAAGTHGDAPGPAPATSGCFPPDAVRIFRAASERARVHWSVLRAVHDQVASRGPIRS